MTGPEVAQTRFPDPAYTAPLMRWRLTVADRLLGAFVACALIPLAAIATLWFVDAPVTDPTTPFPYILVLSFLCGISIFETRVRNRLTRLTRLQYDARSVTARLDPAAALPMAGDELDDLTNSFDTMVGRMQEQLRTLTVIHEIDRAVLSTLDSREIVDTILTRAGDIAACQAVVVALAPAEGRTAWWTVRGNTVPGTLEASASVEPAGWEIEELWSRGEAVAVDTRVRSRSYLALDAMTAVGIHHFLVFPFFRDGAITGLMALGYRSAPTPSSHDRIRIHRLVDQLTLALSNARLLEKVNDLNWGTVTALARTIDACSPWTAGHSERVTQLALAIGRELGLSKRKQDTLHRGGLLHDIGKIGIAPSILNKASQLTAREIRIMQDHPRLGAEILAPVPQYVDLVPIVLHHHERIDGTGYPHGLAGNDIPFLARILAVADVFDALRSERPYRPALPKHVVVKRITKLAGSHLDPIVVEALRAVHARPRSKKQLDIADLTLDMEAFYACTH